MALPATRRARWRAAATSPLRRLWALGGCVLPLGRGRRSPARTRSGTATGPAAGCWRCRTTRGAWGPSWRPLPAPTPGRRSAPPGCALGPGWPPGLGAPTAGERASAGHDPTLPARPGTARGPRGSSPRPPQCSPVPPTGGLAFWGRCVRFGRGFPPGLLGLVGSALVESPRLIGSLRAGAGGSRRCRRRSRPDRERPGRGRAGRSCRGTRFRGGRFRGGRFRVTVGWKIGLAALWPGGSPGNIDLFGGLGFPKQVGELGRGGYSGEALGLKPAAERPKPGRFRALPGRRAPSGPLSPQCRGRGSSWPVSG